MDTDRTAEIAFLCARIDVAWEKYGERFGEITDDDTAFLFLRDLAVALGCVLAVRCRFADPDLESQTVDLIADWLRDTMSDWRAKWG